MRPVMMQQLTSDVEAYRAAVASLLDVDLDVLPTYKGLAAAMQWDAWFATELNLTVLRFDAGMVGAPPGYWLARLQSPYPGYDTHSIVCAGPRAVHDPHPEPQEYTVGEKLLTLELYLPLDPSEPFGRYALR